MEPVFFSYYDGRTGRIYYDKSYIKKRVGTSVILECGTSVRADVVYTSEEALIKRESRLSGKFYGYKPLHG